MSVAVPLAALAAGAGAALWMSGAPPIRGSGHERWRRATRSRRGVLALIAAAAAVGSAASVLAGHVTYAVWAALAGAASLAFTRHWRRRARRREALVRRARMLAACDLLAAELRAGRPPSVALRSAAQEWDELNEVVRADTYGADVPAAWRRIASRPGGDDLRLVAAAWSVSERTGSGLAQALGRVMTLSRTAAATRRTVDSELASARATARLIAGLPLAALAIGGTAGGDPLHFLLATPIGLACLSAGLGIGAVGLAWIERIADDVLRGR